MPWKAPYRPRRDSEITQTYSDGLVKVYAVADTAAPGYKPVEGLTFKAACDTRSGVLASSGITRDGRIRLRSSGCCGFHGSPA